MAYQIGDRVVVVKIPPSSPFNAKCGWTPEKAFEKRSRYLNEVCEIIEIDDPSADFKYRLKGPHPVLRRWSFPEDCIKPYQPKPSIMSTLREKFSLAFKAEPERSFRKAKITNGDDFLTPEGQEIFLSWLLKKHGDEFKKDVVDPILEEQEDEE